MDATRRGRARDVVFDLAGESTDRRGVGWGRVEEAGRRRRDDAGRRTRREGRVEDV